MKPSNVIVLENIICPGTKLESAFVLPIPSFKYDKIKELQQFLIPHLDDLEKQIDERLNPEERLDGGTGVTGISSGFRYYNLFELTDPVMIRFIDWFKECCKDYQEVCLDIIHGDTILGQCWANKLRQFQNIKIHAHSPGNEPNIYTAHFDLKIPKHPTDTIYYDMFFEDHFIRKQNVDGELTIFPAALRHSTTPNGNPEPRYTLGMDMVFDFDFIFNNNTRNRINDIDKRMTIL